jgi:hypothetical protein
MNKKILFGAVLSLLLPLSALASVDITLDGGTVSVEQGKPTTMED